MAGLETPPDAGIFVRKPAPSEMKRQAAGWEKIFATHVSTKDLPPENTENSQNLTIRKQTTQLKNGHTMTRYMTKTDIHIANKT